MITKIIKLNTLNLGRQWLLDTLFPRYCAGCGVADSDLCDQCVQNIIPIKHQACIRCQKITPGGRTCETCKPKTAVYQTLSAAHYHDGPLKEALHTLKYHGRRELITPLIELLNRPEIMKHLQSLSPSGTVCIPMPLYRKRLWWRGFNQSKLITDQLVQILCFSTSDQALKRHTAGKIQSTLTRRDRQHNVQHAFVVTQPHLIANKTVVLVDDIITTGSTMMAAAATLRACGAKRVLALAIARG